MKEIDSIDYVVSININGSSGKEKGTREKADRLYQKGKSVRIFSLKNDIKNPLKKLFSFVWIELKYLSTSIFSSIKPDVIFTRSFFGFGTWLSGKINNIPVIREVHADLWDEAKILYDNKIVLWFFRILHRIDLFFIRTANAVIFNNNKLERHFIDRYDLKNNTISISNGCDTKRFYPIITAKARKSLGLDQRKKYLLFIGEVSKWHGVEYLLEIQKEIKEQCSDIILLIVGGGNNSQVEELREKYSMENIHFIGMVKYETALLYINACDVSLIPVNDIRVSPGSPLKLFDSIACGKPVITQKNTLGYSDIVKKHKLGTVCNFKKPKIASQKILNFLDSYDSDFYCQNNRNIAEIELEWDCIIDQWLTFAAEVKKF
jgi:glycosyltransferase involved in cell wall biosynthesis